MADSSPIQLDNFFIPSKPRLCRQAMMSAAAVAQPQIENNIRLDAVFKKPLYIARKLVGHGDKGVCAVIASNVPVEQHVIDYGQHVIIEIIFPRIPFAFFAKLRRNRGRMLYASNSKALFLKQPGILSKVFIILIALFLRFSQIILPALTYAFRRRTRSRWRSRALRGKLRCPSTARSCGAGIFFCSIPAREDQHFPRDSSPAILGTDIDLRYLGHIRRSRTIFSAERRRSRRVLRCRPNDDNLCACL